MFLDFLYSTVRRCYAKFPPEITSQIKLYMRLSCPCVLWLQLELEMVHSSLGDGFHPTSAKLVLNHSIRQLDMRSISSRRYSGRED